MTGQAPETQNIDTSWLTRKTKRSDAVVVSQYCPDRPYLELEVPVGFKRVRRVVFTTVSHDQGFSDSGGDSKGTYSGSFSWFEAAIIAPSGHDRVDRRNFQFNLHAVFQQKKHVNTWDDSTEDPEVKRFLRTIQGGDKVCIIPKVRHVGWLNYVYEAEIELSGREEDVRSPIIQRVGSLKTSDSLAEHTTVYRQLKQSPQEIRLVTLVQGEFDDDIVCELQYVSFDDQVWSSYESLSYCWGDAEDLRLVHVANPAHVEGTARNASMHVTANLVDAFRYLRYKDRPRTLWVDAVCINQLDLPERSKQVALMPQIYSRATGIVVWLGPSTEAVSSTFRDLQMIQRRLEEVKGDLRPANEAPRDVRGDVPIQDLHRPILDSGGLLVNSPLFDYDYFHRTWVLQEVFNARNVVVYCGKHIVEWAPILRLNQCLINSMLIPNPVGKSVLPALFAGLFEVDNGPRDARKLSYKNLPGKMDILDVILRGLDLEASDPRDKIFAMLTFGAETSVIETLPDSLLPNYKKNVPSVFADFTRWWITKHKSLRILSAVHMSVGRTWQSLTNNPTPVEQLLHPSWSCWHSGKSFWARASLGLPRDNPYSAALDTVPDEQLLADPVDYLRLSLKGYIVGPVASIDRYPFFQMQSHVQECENSESCPYDAMHAAYKNLFDPIDEWGTWRYGATHQAPEILAQRRHNSSEEWQMKLNDHYKAHLRCLQQTGAIECHGACFFTMEDRKPGLCPPGTQEGDLVVVLLGGQVPYVLRPRQRRAGTSAATKGEYYFVGECYVVEQMYGAVMGEKMMKDEAPEVFHLV